MDIAALSMAMANMNRGLQVGVAVADLAQGAMVQQGEAVQELIASSSGAASLEQSVTPHLGANVDVKL